MKTAIVFPGQGSQSVGMMAGFADLPVVKSTFELASRILGEDLWSLAETGPAEAQNRTVITQPLMLTAGVACWRAWREQGGAMPAFFAGHSLGEYSALVAAGSLAFEEALPLVRLRAQAMQEAVPEGTGGIAAIVGLDDALIGAVCDEASQGEVLEPANLNSPGQIVIAGHRGAVERGMAVAKSKGARIVKMLPMSAPSHCSLMKPAAERLREALAGVAFTAPGVPVVQNADVEAFSDPDRIRRALVEQLYRPVRWVETVRHLESQGVTRLLECGPGKVLVGLAKRTAPELQLAAITDSAALAAALA
jgi:[acyl-carrier-protein] S-malonyltransferase